MTQTESDPVAVASCHIARFGRLEPTLTRPRTTTGNPPSMGRPSGVTTSSTSGAAYTTDSPGLVADDCRGVDTTTNALPAPRGVLHVMAVSLRLTTAHSVPPTSTTTGQGMAGKPVPVTTTRPPPGVPTACKGTTAASTGGE